MRIWNKHLAVISTVILACALTRPSLAFEETDAAQIRPDRDTAHIVTVSEGWAVWRTSELIEETRFNRGQRFIHCFYRQRLSDPVADFAFRVVAGPGWGRERILTIAPDGTISFADGYAVKWCDSKRTISTSERVGNGMICRVYVDGIVVQAGSRSVNHGKGIEAAPAWFIPFDGMKLDFAHQLDIVPAGVRSFWDTEPVRHGNVLTWMTPDRLHFFNLKKGERWTTLIEDKNTTEFNLQNCFVTAFDGQTILAGSNVVLDAETGKRLATNWNDKRINRLFATHDRIGYRTNQGQLDAIHIMDPTRSAVDLTNVRSQSVWQDSKGLLFWNGTAWKHLPWLSAADFRTEGPEKQIPND